LLPAWPQECAQVAHAHENSTTDDVAEYAIILGQDHVDKDIVVTFSCQEVLVTIFTIRP
jgi:hypothetical protein